VRLNAATPGALSDPMVHDTVVSSAEAIAERTGVVLVSIEVDDGGVTAIVEGGRMEALGLAAELRRLTGAWYTRHVPGEHLWVEPPIAGGEPEDGPEEGPDDGPDGGPDADGRPPYGLPEFTDPYAFDDDDLLMSDPDVLHDMENIEENLSDEPSSDPDGPDPDRLDPDGPDRHDPDDPHWRRRDDPLGP
jgi:hypothetical protein